MEGISKKRGRSIALLVVGVMVGGLLITPAGAHVGGTVGHLWKKHMLPLAKKAFYTKAQANDRYLGKGATAADSEKLDGVDSTGFLSATGTAVDSEKLDGISSEGFYAAGSKVADSDKVDGVDAATLTRVGRMGWSGLLGLTTSDQTLGSTLSITAPSSGFVRVNGGVNFYDAGCTSGCTAVAHVRHIETGTTSLLMAESGTAATSSEYGALPLNWVFPVTAGVNTFEIRLRRFSGDGTLYGRAGELTGEFSPFGATGGSALQ